MFFRCSINKTCDITNVVLSGNNIDYVHRTKYLGVLLCSDMKTSIDVCRQTSKFYAQANSSNSIITACMTLLYLSIHQSDNGGDQCYFNNYFLNVIYLFFYCMYVFFIIMFYCVYGQMSEINNYYYYYY